MFQSTHKFILLLFVVSLSVITVFPQQLVYAEGMQLYSQKKYEKVVKLFSKAVKQEDMEKNHNIWNVLGLSYIETSDLKNARKALRKAVDYNSTSASYRANLAYVNLLLNRFDESLSESEKAINFDPQNENAHYFRGLSNLWKGNFEESTADADRLIAINSAFTNAYILKADSYVYTYGSNWEKSKTPLDNLDLLKKSIEVLEKCVSACRSADQPILEEKISDLKVFYDHFSKKKKSSDYTEVKILTKPVPGYSDSARYRGTQGEILLAVLFDSSGEIGRVLVLKGLPNGLSERAVKAAKAIKFEPAKENGNPVSVVKRIQYNFTIY